MIRNKGGNVGEEGRGGDGVREGERECVRERRNFEGVGVRRGRNGMDGGREG